MAYGTTHSQAADTIPVHITDQSALCAREEDDFRVDMLVDAGARVEQGAPVLRSRRHNELMLVAPVAGEVASVDLGPGKRLSQVVFFHASGNGRRTYDVAALRSGANPAEIRAALLSSGLWPLLRSRPFGRFPLPGEVPAAIVVMAADTRPGASPPALALAGREEDFERGMAAISTLTSGPLLLCRDAGSMRAGPAVNFGKAVVVDVAPAHPRGLPGLQIARRCPATVEHPVWDIHAEDVAGIGAFLSTGLVPETKLVSMTGDALRESMLVRCQPGADLRALCFDIVKPGPHRLLSGSEIDGVESRWLTTLARQLAAVKMPGIAPRPHWFATALRRSGRPLPIIPTAALDQAFASMLPAAPLVRALAANDAETAVRLGALSLVEEDLALADSMTGATPRLASMLRAMLDRIEVEGVA